MYKKFLSFFSKNKKQHNYINDTINECNNGIKINKVIISKIIIKDK